MKFQHQVLVLASTEWLWEFVTDIPQVAMCIPWMEDIEKIDEQRYKSVINIRVGPISLAMDSLLIIEEINPGEFRGSFRAEISDRRAVGTVHMKMYISLDAKTENQTMLIIDTDAIIAGKLGEFGQSILRRKADSLMDIFAKNIAKKAEEQL
jgi:carbon monoxide dehydrogenase subunit G